MPVSVPLIDVISTASQIYWVDESVDGVNQQGAAPAEGTAPTEAEPQEEAAPQEEMAEEEGVPYQSLINLYLRDCVSQHRKIDISWKGLIG